MAAADDPLWYQRAVIYQAHVRSFFDSNDDGVGDFKGLTARLDYVQSLGVSAIWLLPFYPSPLRDDGYDIAEYTGIHPTYGTPEDFRRFLDEAHARGLKVITELVINHTSDQHPWFQAARRAPVGSNERNFYVWSDTDQKYAGVRIIFSDTERSNWSWDPIAGQYYWHRFFHHQPDLNFDHPPVREAVKKLMAHWLEQGVDGLRLDAVPYLIERDGTSCAGLPETHAVLRELRRELDAKFRDRMLLAEANLWPSDVIAYFGDGDECHMAFHFPLMPRLYMALRQEDRHPISEILYQTPEIPPTCQWAIFLRNHDELTLEMVTDEERDYMYQAYAADPVMRVNAGIRRRLATMMENSRARIELMHGLLLSLPGTPVIYYGDEIGMGDNVYLGDRNSVRTPMQWTADRNGGFSRADPARLYAPLIMDPVYGYQSVNVESQDRSPHSLLNWMRRQIALRNRYPAFGRGTLELLRPENRRVFAFVRRFEAEDPILVVANLSRTMQAVRLDLSSYVGLVPSEVSGGTDLPRITDAPYFLTLGPYGFYWLTLQKPVEHAIAASWGAEPEPSQLPILLGPDWSLTLQGRTRAHLERHHLPAFLRRQPWFADGGATHTAHIVDWGILASAPEPAAFALVTTGRAAGDGMYATPLVMASGADAAAITHDSPAAIVAGIGGARPGVLHGSLEPALARALFALVANDGEVALQRGRLRGVSAAGADLNAEVAAMPVTPIGASPRGTNGLVRFGERVVLKLYRRLWAGEHPEVEAGRQLAAIGFARTPRLLGHVEYRPDAGGNETGNVYTVAVLHSFAPHQTNGWQQATGELARFLDRAMAWRDVTPQPPPDLNVWTAEVPDQARQAVGDYLENIAMLGRRTAEVHHALGAIGRIHGALRLSEVLRSEADYWIVDFEGTPDRPFNQRRLRDHVLVDVATFLRSIDEMTAATLAARAIPGPQERDLTTAWGRLWAAWVWTAFVQAYRQTAASTGLIAGDTDASSRLQRELGSL